MKKRFLSLVLGSTFCLSLLGAAFAASADTVESDNGWINLDPGLYEVYDENGNYKDTVRVDEDGIISNPNAVTPGSSINGQTVVKPSAPGPSNPGTDPTPTPTPGNQGGGWYPSTPSTPSYSVSAPSSTPNGKVTLDKTSAKKGDTVTITATPDKGYKVDSVIVRDANGNSVSVNNLGNNKYSFIMPDGKVSVNATFVADTPAPQVTFTDVPADAFYADAVAWAVENGITNGTSATQFSPNQTCTRAQTVTFLWRAAGSPKASSTNSPFTDVTPGTYYYDAVLWAVENGITNGTGATTFSPDDTVTRGQVVTFQYRAAKAQATTGNNPFVDVDGSAYYANAVQWAVNNSVTNGTSTTTFSPNEGCTRGQIVTFLYRAK